MWLISVNVGKPQTVRWHGREITSAIFKQPLLGRATVRKLNIDGDQQADLNVHGGADKAVYCYSSSHYSYWREELQNRELPWGAFGENFTIEGLLWDDEDGFFYDVLHMPDDSHVPVKLRSMVGLIPLFAVETLEPEMLDRMPGFRRRMEWFIANRPDLINNVACMRTKGMAERRLLSNSVAALYASGATRSSDCCGSNRCSSDTRPFSRISLLSVLINRFREIPK